MKKKFLKVAIKVIKRQTNLTLPSNAANFRAVTKTSLFTFKADNKSFYCFAEHVFGILCVINEIKRIFKRKNLRKVFECLTPLVKA